jgi:uncharacterized membrane protein YfcA
MVVLLSALGVVTLAYVIVWIAYLRITFSPAGRITSTEAGMSLAPQLGIGFFANFMDTLGVGSFAITSSIYKLLRTIPDDLIPGTMNVGHTVPVTVEAFIFVAVVAVDFRLLVAMIFAAVLGAWFGAGMVSDWPKRRIQVGLGMALLAAAMLMLASQLNLYAGGGDALGLVGWKFWVAIGCNFIFAAFQQLGVGIFAPSMILLYLLGMNPRADFPIMMGSAAFLMPFGSYRFIQSGRYSPKAALGLTLGGIPGVLLAAYVVKQLPLTYVRWLVVLVVLYTAVMLLRSASEKTVKAAISPTPEPQLPAAE